MLDVWKVDVDSELPRLDLHCGFLDDDEIARAARFRQQSDRGRFIVGRSTRRQLLARMLGRPWSELAFEADADGKPRLKPSPGPSLKFNSSHSGRWVLHAFAATEVGVDVEEIRPAVASLQELGWVLSSEERAYVEAADDRLRADAFTTVWVRKEAYVKALGDGLNCSLAGIGIVAGRDGKPTLAYDRNDRRDDRHWRFCDLEIDGLHKGCVVHAGPDLAPAVRSYRC